jgi:two-component system, NtrC family, response regulator HydG
MSRTVLVVDDDRQMVKTFAAVLRRRGWESLTAFDGEQAVQVARDHHVDVVLMDVRMPGMNGVEALRAIRQSKPLTPVILMTAYAANELLEQAERDGALSIMPKPVPLPRLLTLLEDVIHTERSVLIVDDDPQFLSTLTEVLSTSGRAVLKAGTLEQALELLDAQTPDIVVLDLKLDDSSPEETIRAIKNARPAVVLILYSGHPLMLDETLASLPSELVYASLRKPFSPASLMGLLDDLTRK